MMKFMFIIFLSMALVFNLQELFAQTCGTRQLDSSVAAFLKMIGNKDLTIEQLRTIPIEQIKFAGPPPIPYPAADVKRIKVTADSIPVLIFNPAHTQNLPMLINYHGGGFISPLLAGLEYSLWLDAKTYGAIIFAIDYRVAPENKFPAAVNDCYNAFKWIAAHGSEFGGDTSRIALTGNSCRCQFSSSSNSKSKKRRYQQ